MTSNWLEFINLAGMPPSLLGGGLLAIFS